MNTPPISNDHLMIAQRIIAFVQEQGWDIHGIRIERFVDSIFPFGSSQDEPEAWKHKTPERKWALTISVGPRDERELKERKLINQ